MPYALHIVDEASSAPPQAGAGRAVSKPYLRIEMAGPLDAGEMRSCLGEVVELVALRSLDALLVDIRAATTGVDPGSFFFVAEEAARNRGRRPSTALLAREDQRRDAEYMENSAQNRGIPFRAFFDLAESLRWLGVTDDQTSGPFGF